jgi:hypothetical protein
MDSDSDSDEPVFSKHDWWKGSVPQWDRDANAWVDAPMPVSAYPSPLYQSLIQGDIKLVTEYLDEGGDPDALITVEWGQYLWPNHEVRPLHVACGLLLYMWSGKLTEWDKNVHLYESEYDAKGRPCCRVTVVELLLQRSADVNATYVHEGIYNQDFEKGLHSAYSDLLPRREHGWGDYISRLESTQSRYHNDNFILRVLLRLNDAFTDNQQDLGMSDMEESDGDYGSLTRYVPDYVNPRVMPHYAAETMAVQHFREFKHQFHSDEKSWLAIIASATRAWDFMVSNQAEYLLGLTPVCADVCSLILAYAQFEPPTWFETVKDSSWWRHPPGTECVSKHSVVSAFRWLTANATVGPDWWKTWRVPAQRDLVQARITDYFDPARVIVRHREFDINHY